jgi:hypothetical protein
LILPRFISIIPPLEDVEKHYYSACALAIPHKQAQDWWYFSNMKKDELFKLTFKLYDSDKSNVWAVPHSSFQNDIESAIPRESGEIRYGAFFKEG